MQEKEYYTEIETYIKRNEIKNEKIQNLQYYLKQSLILTQLGNGYTFVGSQYKINITQTFYYLIMN